MLLSLIWLGVGLLMGLLGYLARSQPTLWARSKRLDLLTFLMLGAIIAFCSGWFCVLLLGRLFSIVTILWITIMAVVMLPWLIVRVRTKREQRQRVV